MTTGYAIHALESTFGVVPATGWREIPIEADNIQPRTALIAKKGIVRTSGAPRPSRLIENGADGAVPLEVTPNAIGMFLALCADSSVVTTPTGATLARQHVHTFGSNGPPSNVSMTSEFYRNRLDGTIDLYQHRGGQATALDLTLDSSGTTPLGMSVAMNYGATHALIVANEDGLPTRTSTAPDTGLAFGFTDVQATLTPRGGSAADRCLVSLKLTAPTGLKYEARICTDGPGPLGRTATPAPTGELVMDYTDPHLAKDFLNGTIYGLTIVGTLPTAIEGSTFPSITITIDGIQWTGKAPNLVPDSRTNQALPFNVIDDPANSNPAMVITRITTDTAI